MRKKIMAIALITGLTMATAASAHWGRGDRGNGGYGGYGDCPRMQGQMQGQMQGPMYQQLDQATQDKIKQFFKDTQPLHKEMAMKRAEKQALMQSDKPDPQAVAKVTGEMYDLRTTIHEKAEQAGVDKYIGPGRMGRGFGMGRGMMGQGGMMNDDSDQNQNN